MRPSREPGPARPSRGPPGPWPSRTPPGRSNEPQRPGVPSGRSVGCATETVTRDAAVMAVATIIAILGMRLITDSLESGTENGCDARRNRPAASSHAGSCRHLQRPAATKVPLGRGMCQPRRDGKPASLEIFVRPSTEEIATLHAGRILPHHLGRAADDPRRTVSAAAVP